MALSILLSLEDMTHGTDQCQQPTHWPLRFAKNVCRPTDYNLSWT